MAIAHDDAKRSASFQPRRRSALTTSLANMRESGYDPMEPGSIATIGLYPLHTGTSESQTNLLLTDSRMKYSDICDSLKSSGTELSDQAIRYSPSQNKQLTLSEASTSEPKGSDKATKGTFLTSLETVTAPSLTEAVLTRPDLVTTSVPNDPIVTGEVLIPPRYAKKTDFSPPFTMMPRGPIQKMVIDRNRTRSLLDRGLLASHEGFTEEDRRLITGPDIEKHLMSPRASEFIKYAYKRVCHPLEQINDEAPSSKRLTTTREGHRGTSSTSNPGAHLYQDVCGLYSTYPHHAVPKQSIRPPTNLMKTLWNQPLTPRTRDKEYIKLVTLQPPETHYKHLYKHERSPSGLTFEEMLKYVPQNEIEYNIFNVYRWRPTWYNLKGWGDPHSLPSIADLSMEKIASIEQQTIQHNIDISTMKPSTE
ncbi:Hypothetical protein GLP15_5186 [Giardia lamblia P15]|uniref:Uncharacterized protein n=1 Tax=Giardia intestinalis (strain P15) TaxID=658858 RepID=E1EWB5_GIAIA|nr:Hypothetical protein GLP15_5186 [Giardia lamblia P15]